MKKKYIILFIITIIFINFITYIFLYNSSKPSLGNGSILNITHIIVKLHNSNSYITKIYSFDNDNIVMSTRYKIEYDTIETAQSEYNKLKEKVVSKSINGNTITYTSRAEAGATKSWILEQYNGKYGTSDEILEY